MKNTRNTGVEESRNGSRPDRPRTEAAISFGLAALALLIWGAYFTFGPIMNGEGNIIFLLPATFVIAIIGAIRGELAVRAAARSPEYRGLLLGILAMTACFCSLAGSCALGHKDLDDSWQEYCQL